MSYFSFNGKSCKDFGLTVEAIPNFLSARRETEVFQIPGKSGDFIHQNGRYKNLTQEYDVFLNPGDESYIASAKKIANWLGNVNGYARLEDDYDPDSFRMAYFAGPLDMTNWFRRKGRATLEFICRPQRYRKAGEEELAVSFGTPIINTGMPAEPYVSITYPDITTNENTKTIILLNGKTWFTAEYMTFGGTVTVDTYTGKINSSASSIYPIHFNADMDLKLEPGENKIEVQMQECTGGSASTDDHTPTVKIIPRWWDL